MKDLIIQVDGSELAQLFTLGCFRGEVTTKLKELSISQQNLRKSIFALLGTLRKYRVAFPLSLYYMLYHKPMWGNLYVLSLLFRMRQSDYLS